MLTAENPNDNSAGGTGSQTYKMRHVSNNTLGIFAMTIVLASLAMNSYIIASVSNAAGAVSSEEASKGTIEMCINARPVISHSCSGVSYIGTTYTCDIDAVDENGQNLTFYDNTGLFDIEPATGLIRFTPKKDDAGEHSINITARDNSSCSNNRHSIIFNLSVTSQYCGDGICGRNEDCSSCPADCGTCPEEERRPSGGGGAGGMMFDIDFTRVESKLVTGYEGDSIIFTFNGITAHTMVIESVEDGSIKVRAGSGEAVIGLDEAGRIDMNLDGRDDLNIALLEIDSNRKARMRVTMLEGGHAVSREAVLPVETYPETVKVFLRAGGNHSQPLTIVNTGRYDLKMVLNASNEIKRFLDFPAGEFIVMAGRNRTVELFFSAPENTVPDIYTGELYINILKGGQGIIKKVLVIIEIESVEVLFDTSINIHSGYRDILAGGEIKADFTIFNLKDTGRVEVEIEYIIKSMDSSIIKRSSEMVSIKEQTIVTKSIRLPEDMQEGNYIIAARVMYEDSISTSSQMFYVSKSREQRIEEAREIAEEKKGWYVALIILVSVALIASASIAALRLKSKVERIEAESQKKLKNRIRDLENAYESEYQKIYGLLEDIEQSKIKELEHYIKRMIDRGFKKEHIRKHLKRHGWVESHIEKAMSGIRMKKIEEEIERLRSSLKK